MSPFPNSFDHFTPFFHASLKQGTPSTNMPTYSKSHRSKRWVTCWTWTQYRANKMDAYLCTKKQKKQKKESRIRTKKRLFEWYLSGKEKAALSLYICKYIPNKSYQEAVPVMPPAKDISFARNASKPFYHHSSVSLLALSFHIPCHVIIIIIITIYIIEKKHQGQDKAGRIRPSNILLIMKTSHTPSSDRSISTSIR